ncbi:MAG: hypothetical protein ABIL01_03420 [Pseudomonadota bacterium]
MEQIKSTTELPLVNALTRSGRHEAQAARHSMVASGTAALAPGLIDLSGLRGGVEGAIASVIAISRD